MFQTLFQTFTDDTDPARGATRAQRLRSHLMDRGLEGFIVPRADEHQNEYVPKSAERLAWLTGFTGSAGMAIVLKKSAAIFVDGRYTLQVRAEVDGASFEFHNSGEMSPEAWLEAHARPAQRIGFDPWLHTPAQAERLEKAVRASGAQLIAVRSNLVDEIWEDRPSPPQGPVRFHPEKLAGDSAAKKIGRVRASLGAADALLISDPHAIAWLFNIRGSDIAHTPIALGFALLPREGKPVLYMAGAKLGADVRTKLGAQADFAEPDALVGALEALSRGGRRLLCDSATVPAKLVSAIRHAGGEVELGPDPIARMKAVKNAAELAGMRAAHLRDGAAVCRFLAWFDWEAPSGRLSEIDAASALEAFRRETKALKDVSFPTIAGYGANGAIVHYRVNETSNRKIEKGNLFLLDSGAQYEDGTTDITRTVAIGKPSAEMRDRFTRVLKGHIAIARAIFPKGTSGAQIDAYARRPLWEAGLDFDHGTGHGVGAYLSVHEGPQRISKLGSVALEAGMILSNEPGYYKEGAYGIRIENLVAVATQEIAGGERAMLGFETLTLVPIDQALIETKLLSRDELKWIDAYHARVKREIRPLVDAPVQQWLDEVTAPLAKG